MSLQLALIRPPDLVGTLRFYRVSSSSSIFFLQLPSQLAEQNSTKTGHMLESERNLKMYVRNLRYPLSLIIGDPKTTYSRRFCNLTATLTAYIFGTKYDIHNRATALKTTRALLHRLKMLWTLIHKRLKIGPEISPTRHWVWIALTVCRRKVGVVLPKKLGPRTFYNCSVFRWLPDLISNIF